MRLLLIHADSFRYETTGKSPETSRVQSLSPAGIAAQAEECLVVFVAVEKDDETNPSDIVDRAVAEINQLGSELSVQHIVLYPYAHLAPRLASSSAAVRILDALADSLVGREVHLAPFGWYKSYTIKCKGHPRSESYREISTKQAAPVVVSRGQEHPVCRLNQRFRDVFLDLGLDEMINPCIVDDSEVYKQYGPEAPIILDRVFYLAGLPRPDIGISQTEMVQISTIAPGFSNMEALATLFRDYKRGTIESDDLTQEMAARLNLSEAQVIRILDDVFPQFRALEPLPVHKTLRSHMTSLWFPVMARLQSMRPLPIRLFAIGPRFRREQREDTRHLFESTAVSIAIMDRAFTIEAGQELTEQILKRLGFRKFSFREKAVTSNYYASGTDTEVYVEFAGRDIEVANLGFYATEALAKYDIEYPVFNLGFGSERLAMAFEDAKDIRSLVYPQLYETAEFSDEDIARSLRPNQEPGTEEGHRLVRQLVGTALENRAQIGPVQIPVFEGRFLGAEVKVAVYNWDEGKPLLGSAAANHVFVYETGIYGVPDEQFVQLPDPSDLPAAVQALYEVWQKGINTELQLVQLMMQQAVACLELAIANGESAFDMRVRAVKKPSQINVHVPRSIEEYIEMRKKPVKVVGPIFAGVRAEIAYTDSQ